MFPMDEESRSKPYNNQESRIEFAPRLSDYRAFVLYLNRSRNKPAFWIRILLFPLLGATFVISRNWGVIRDGHPVALAVSFIIILLLSGLWVGFVIWSERAQAKRLFQIGTSESRSVHCSGEGVKSVSASSEFMYKWSAIQEITEDRNLFLFVTGAAGGALQAIFIPKTAFVDEDHYTRFKRTAEDFWRNNK